MKDTKNLNTEYDVKALRRQIIYMMLPIIAENFLQLLTDLSATAMVGRLTELDISAQGMSMKTVDLVYYVFRGTGVALVVVVAKQLAREGIDICRTIFEKTAVATIIIGVALGAFIYMNPTMLLRVFTEEAELIVHATSYLRYLVVCLPFWGITVCVASVYQAGGDTKTPMKIAVFVNVLNIILCYGLIFGNLGMPKMGYLGAALSLVISRTAGCFLGLALLYHKKWGMFSLRGKRKKVERVLPEIYSIGLPNAGEWAAWQIATILLSRIILYYGQSEFAAYQLGVQAEFMTEIPAVGFSVAATSLISRAIGLEDRRLFEVYKKELMRFCVGISIVTSCSLMFLPHVFMGLLTDNDVLIQIGIPYVVIMGSIQLPQNASKIYTGILRSGGYKVMPLVIQVIALWGFRVPLCFLCAYALNLPIISIWVCFALDQLIKSFIYRYKCNHAKILE